MKMVNLEDMGWSTGGKRGYRRRLQKTKTGRVVGSWKGEDCEEEGKGKGRVIRK